MSAATSGRSAQAGQRPTRFVVVGADQGAATDSIQASEAISRRGAAAIRMTEAALRAVLANLALWGPVIAGTAILLSTVMSPGVPTIAWTVVTVGIGSAAGFMPRRFFAVRVPTSTAGGQRQLRPWLVGLACAATGAMALVPWLAIVPSGHGTTAHPPEVAMAIGCAVVVLVGAATLAPLQRLSEMLVAAPISAALATVASAGWEVRPMDLAPHALVAIAVLVVAHQRGRIWRQNTRLLIDQADRVRQLEAERDAAAQADHEKSRFLAIASHDLRQPVHALALFTATLHKRTQHSADEPLVRNMVRAIDGLERSFNSLLDISRLDAGTIMPVLQTFSLRDLFRRLHMHYGGQAEMAGLALRFSPGGKSVHSDPQMLERILSNLIQNAIKYTEIGGIVVVARSTSDAVNVEVWDTGSGIAAEELPKIFDEFYQIGRGERDRAHGLGMGLAIVKRLARLLGHRLTVSSCPGRGTMFRIGIPIGGLSSFQEALAPADTVPMMVALPQMVLVIDDEEPIREGLRGLLQEWGYQVMTAASAAQAEQVAQALEGRIDLILSDLHLGSGPDGLTAIEAVQRLCKNEVAAILITGDTAHTELRRITACGHMVLFKPVQPRRLFDALRDSLG